MGMIGIVTSDPWIDRVKNGTGKALMLQVRFSGDKDVKTVQYMPQSGEDTRPVKGARVAVLQVGGILIAVATQDLIEIPATTARLTGEKEFYSVDGSNKKARFILKKTGKIYFGNTANAKSLCAALDDLMSAINTFSGTASQSAITSGGASATSLAAAIVALLTPLNTAVAAAKTAVDAVLDTSP